MFLKYIHRWSTVLLLVPGMVMANQIGHKKPPIIDWQACFRESGLPFFCGSAEVPLDYNDPGGEKLNLALIKLPATIQERKKPGRKIGSLFFNPGGPGNSGVDFVLGIGQFLPAEIRTYFDVIGFDPRGTSRSSPLLCFDGPVNVGPIIVPQFFFPRNPDEEASKEKFDRNLAMACKYNGGSVLNHMSTANVARDLDFLRQAVGDSKLNYVGYSHGSFLGVTYANLFPNKIRAMVLDGVVDPIAYTTGVGDEGSTLPVTTRFHIDEGSQATLNEFFRLCDQAGADQCPFTNDAAGKFDFMVDHLRATPVPLFDPTIGPFDLVYDQFIATVFSAMANSSGWPLLAGVLNEIHAAIIDGSEDAAERAGTAFFALAAAMGSVTSPDDLTRTAQQFASMCTDTNNPDNYAAWSLAGEAADANVGVFGRIGAWQSSPCAVWQGNDPDRYLGPFTQKTSKPILLVANRFDPLTPYEGALQTHSLLPNSALLTLEGWGHTSLLLSSCVDQAVSRYLLTSKVASPEASCQQDVVPFADALSEPISSGETSPKETSPKNDKVDAKREKMQIRGQALHKQKLSPSGTFEAPSVSATYDPATGTAIIPAVQVGDKVEFSNVKLGFNPGGTLSVLSSEAPQTPVAAASATYDPVTGMATIPEVLVKGKVKFRNVKLKANPDGTFSVLAAEELPVS
jgi:pimeloyl-ACP methyl ester carboxylesterase